MKITLEMIDEIRNQKDVSYNKAKDALKQTNGDLVEAKMVLEQSTTNKTKSLLVDIKRAFNKFFNSSSVLVIIISMILLSLLIIGLINNISIFIPFLI